MFNIDLNFDYFFKIRNLPISSLLATRIRRCSTMLNMSSIQNESKIMFPKCLKSGLHCLRVVTWSEPKVDFPNLDNLEIREALQFVSELFPSSSEKAFWEFWFRIRTNTEGNLIFYNLCISWRAHIIFNLLLFPLYFFYYLKESRQNLLISELTYLLL